MLFQGTLTDLASGNVTVERSTDNVTWETLTTATNHQNGFWHTEPIDR